MTQSTRDGARAFCGSIANFRPPVLDIEGGLPCVHGFKYRRVPTRLPRVSTRSGLGSRVSSSEVDRYGFSTAVVCSQVLRLVDRIELITKRDSFHAARHDDDADTFRSLKLKERNAFDNMYGSQLIHAITLTSALFKQQGQASPLARRQLGTGGSIVSPVVRL